MAEIYVVHSHIHQLDGAGGGGFDWWPLNKHDEAKAAYDAEVALAGIAKSLEVNLYKAEAPDGLDGYLMDEWVFDNFEAGAPSVTPICSFLKEEP